MVTAVGTFGRFSLLVNYRHDCSQSGYKTVLFFISPSMAEQKDVEVCVYPVLPSKVKSVTVDDIKTKGVCQKKMNKNKQFRIPVELNPDHYVAMIYAHSDHSFVSIPALNRMLHKNHYEYEFTMKSCDNHIEAQSSDSYSITLKNSYIWSYTDNPLITVYYTDNTSLKLSQLAKFNKKTFSGVKGYGEHSFRIQNLTPRTEYLFYVKVTSRKNADQSLISNPLRTSTYATCKSDEWPEVGVNEESKIECWQGYHGYLCSPQEGFNAAFTERSDACFCRNETLHGVYYPVTQYGSFVDTGSFRRFCGWKGIWEGVPSRDCDADGEWEATKDGMTAVKKCDNGGHLARKCVYGVWQEVEDMNCKCDPLTVNEIKWPRANREETVTHECMSGSITRTCNWWGHWEEPEVQECACGDEKIWEYQPHNSTQTQPCGTEHTEGNVVSRYCGYDGFWKEEDLSSCMCDNVTEDEITWVSTYVNSASWMECSVGAKARICLPYGMWDDSIGVYNCMCEADQGFASTEAGETASLPCPDNEFKMQTRRCNNAGVWEDVNSFACYGSCPSFGGFAVTLSGTTASVECEEGGGRILMDCLRKIDANGEFYGEWDKESWRVEGECRCKSVDEFPSAVVNTDSEIICDSGKRTQMCGKFTARWEAPVNHDCMCTVHDAPFEVENTPLFGQITMNCEVGSRTITCGKQGHYENVDASQCFCSEDDGFEQTLASSTATAACAERGDRSRLCQASGFWEAVDYSGCQCNGYSPVTDSLPVSGSFTQTCPVGQYNVLCSETGVTSVVDASCSCEAIEGFPQTPADTLVTEACGTNEKTAYCNINGEWTNVRNPCYCPATSDFPAIGYGETAEAYLPQCYKGFCNPETGETEFDYSGCGCEAMDEWPAMQHGENITRLCETGGSRTAVCDMGVISVEYVDCNCLDANNNEIGIGDYLNFPCMIGFVLKQCRGNNFWYNITDSYCGCSSDDEGLNLFEIVNAGESKTVQCGAGSMSIQCDATGHYDMSTFVNDCKCGTDSIWEETPVSTTVTKQCLSGEGTYSRTCGSYGIWGEPTSSCMCSQDGEWSESAPGTHTLTCSETGIQIERTCHEDGTWGAATGSCLDRSCPAEGVFPNIPHLGSYTHTCGNGEVIVRTCNAGLWSTVDWSKCGCADEDGFVSGEYIDEEVYRSTSSQACGVGQKTRVCMYGVWQEVNYNDCFCAAQDVLPVMQANHQYTHQCGVGAITASCNNYGQWEIEADTCGCAEDGDSIDDVVFPAALRGETVSVNCLSGAMTRTCNMAAQWEAVDTTNCLCEDEGWTSVHPMENSQLTCEEGYITRMCKPNGQWGAQSSASCACSATPSYPRTVVLGTATHQCGSGSTSAVCDITGWREEENNDCSCIATEEYPLTPRDTTVEVPCGQYKEGMKTRVCNIHGYWEAEEDMSACVNWCSSIGDWPYAQPNTTVTIPCPEGYTEGSITRYCTIQGLWENAVSTCVPMKCPADNDFPLTPINSVATRSCPEGFTGSLTRHCLFEGGVAMWSEVENTCQEASCSVGDHVYKHNESVSLECGEGFIGIKEQVCHTGVWKEVKNTCTPVMCEADEEHGYPEGHYGDVYHMNCGIDFTGAINMRCNALQEWEYVSGSCTPIQPTLRCVPAENAVGVSLAPRVNDQFTIYCTSNVRIREVINDKEEHMNIHILFDLADSILSYPTTAVFMSDYTVGFVFDGSFPPSCEGILYINAHSFISMNGVSFPSSTLVTSFATREGAPLVPPQLPEGSVQILSVNHAQRTATLKITMPFSRYVYDEGQIAFIRSNLQSQFFIDNVVIVEGAILNSVIPITWRVRKGAYWSDFAAFTVYQPVALLPPATPVTVSYHGTTVEWSWRASESYGLVIDHYHYQVYCDEELVEEGNVSDTSITLSLPADRAYRIRVAACCEGSEVYSDYSESVTLTASVFTPSVPLDIAVVAVSSTHMHITWKQPANCGGASIQYYILRRASHASMQVIEQVYQAEALSLDLYDVTETTYLEIAAFNGYASAFVRFTCSPAELTAVWTTNVDEGIQFDNAVQIHGEFNFMSIATCTLTAALYPDFVMTHVFPASTAVSYTFQPVMADTQYQVKCVVAEVGTAASVETVMTATTVATAELSPALIVDGEPTAAITATVQVTSTVLGRLTCYVAPYEGLASRPTSMEGFASNWAETKEVVSIAESSVFHFPYDVTGMPIDSAVTYHAWCMIEREVVEMVENEKKVTTLVFPEYKEQSTRHTLQVTPFEITAIQPAEFSFNVDPASDIVVSFSAEAEMGEGKITLLDEDNNLVRIPAEDVSCVGTVCTLNLHQSLIPNKQYVLQIEKNAFVSGESELEKAIDNWFFTTGYFRCDTKYVSKGLTDTRMCKCFSVENKCECECGETSVARYL